MKKIFIGLLVLGCSVAPVQQTHAALWFVVQAAIKKAIKAIDLAIQEEQNKVIWLQNAQKEMENVMSKLKLDEITDWVEKQRALYRNYFEELQQVKDIVAYYERVRQVVGLQERIVSEYRRAFSLFKRDDHFNAGEIAYLGKVYDGMLDASARNLDQLMLVIHSFGTQMTDAKRLEIIGQAADGMQQVYDDLRAFNNQNVVVSLQRSKDMHELASVRLLYNVQ